MFDPILSAYKSDEEDFWWIGGPNPCGFFTSGGKFFSWKPYYFILCFWAEASPISFAQRAGILAIIAC